jgi:hypothetical protein
VPDEPQINQTELFGKLDRIVDLLEEIRDKAVNLDLSVTRIELASANETSDATDTQILETLRAINTTVANQGGGGADP